MAHRNRNHMFVTPPRELRGIGRGVTHGLPNLRRNQTRAARGRVLVDLEPIDIEAATTPATSTTQGNGQVNGQANEVVIVKTEPERQALATEDNKVLIMVGAKNSEHYIRSGDLNKSNVLSNMARRNGRHTYVMHPELRQIDSELFTSAAQFMRLGSYVPNIVNMARTERIGLEGLRTSLDYSRELVRAGKLYVLAEALQIKGLQNHVYTKISQTQFQTYTIKSMLELALTIFGRRVRGDQTQTEQDDLEKWIIETLVERFQPMLMEQSAFYVYVTSATNQRRFAIRLLRAKADQIEKAGAEPQILDD